MASLLISLEAIRSGQAGEHVTESLSCLLGYMVLEIVAPLSPVAKHDSEGLGLNPVFKVC